jgi:hypothetical protein
MVPSSQPDYNVQQTSNLICAPPNQQAPLPPPPPTGPQQTYHYQPQQPMPRYKIFEILT